MMPGIHFSYISVSCFQATKKKFLKTFMSSLRKKKTEKKKLKRLFKELSPLIAKRGAGKHVFTKQLMKLKLEQVVNKC